jgi:1-acyl-sn-glycerol-3-phosphate acyltransferase
VPQDKNNNSSFFENLSWKLAPIYRQLARLLVFTLYRVEFIGFEKIPKDGPVILISNHISYVDGLILQAACKRPIIYIIDKPIYELPVVNYFMRLSKAIPIFPKKEDVQAALNQVSRALENGEAVCIFPEGQLTYTGHLGRFKPGVEWIIERDPVQIYPIALRGLWGSIFSRKYIKARFRWLPRSFRRPIKAVCGNVIHPEQVKVNQMQKIILQLRREHRMD